MAAGDIYLKQDTGYGGLRLFYRSSTNVEKKAARFSADGTAQSPVPPRAVPTSREIVLGNFGTTSFPGTTGYVAAFYDPGGYGGSARWWYLRTPYSIGTNIPSGEIRVSGDDLEIKIGTSWYPVELF